MFDFVDKRYFRPRFIFAVFRHGRRRTWGRLTEAERQEVRQLALKYNFTVVEKCNGKKVALGRIAIGGFHEYHVDFGFKRLPAAPEQIIQLLDQDLFKMCIRSNPQLLVALLADDQDTLRKHIGYSDHALFIRERVPDRAKMN